MSRKKKPDLPDGFDPQTTRRCEDCDLRNALDLLGRPIYRDGNLLTLNCEAHLCNGSGRIPVPPSGQTDPYFTGKGL